MTFFDRQIKVGLVFHLMICFFIIFFSTRFGFDFIQWWRHVSYVVTNPKNNPVGEINFSFNDSYRDTWNKSTSYPYKDFNRHGYDLRLMSDLPANQQPLANRVYFEKTKDNTLQYVLRSGTGQKIEGTLDLSVGKEPLSKQSLESQKVKILNLLIDQKHENVPSNDPDYDYEMCLMSKLPSNGQPFPRRVYFEHTQTPGILKCIVLSASGKKTVGEIRHHLGDSLLSPEDLVLKEQFKYNIFLHETDPVLREKFKTQFKNLGANFDIEGGRYPLTKNNLEHAKYELLKETAKKGLTAYKNWITIYTSWFRPTRFIINNGEITIPYAEGIDIKYYGQRGKKFRDLRINLINRRGAPLEEVIPQLKELIKSLDAAGWQRAPGYERVIGKLDDKLMVIRLFDIPRPRDVDFIRWTKDEYVLSINGYAKIAHYPKEKKPYRLAIVTRLEISKDLNFNITKGE